jgi:hypothetical protein
VGLISSATRQDDVELMYWALGLMHECAVKDVLRDQFRKIDSLLQCLVNNLNIDNPGLCMIVLRIFKFLGLRQPEFQKKCIQLGLLSKIIPCLDTTDEDCQYWSLTLLHDYATHPEATVHILTHEKYHVLQDLANCHRPLVSLYVVDIITCLCGSSTATSKLILETKTLDTISIFLEQSDPDLVSGGLSCIFNLALISSDLIEELILMGTNEQIARIMLRIERGRIEIMSSKVICMMHTLFPGRLASWVSEMVLQPYLLNVFLTVAQNTIQALHTIHSNEKLKSLSLQDPVPESKSLFSGQRKILHNSLDIPTTVSSKSSAPEPHCPSTPQGDLTLASPSSPLTIDQNLSSPDSATIQNSPDSSNMENVGNSASTILALQLEEHLDGILQSLCVFSQFPNMMENFFEVHANIIELLVDGLYDLVILPMVDDDLNLKPSLRYDKVVPPTTPSQRSRFALSLGAIQVLSHHFQYGLYTFQLISCSLRGRHGISTRPNFILCDFLLPQSLFVIT